MALRFGVLIVILAAVAFALVPELLAFVHYFEQSFNPQIGGAS